MGSDFGYFVNPAKCCLIVDRSSLTAVQDCYYDLVEENFKVKQWVSCVHRLAEISVIQPQAAFAALTKSLQCE